MKYMNYTLWTIYEGLTNGFKHIDIIPTIFHVFLIPLNVFRGYAQKAYKPNNFQQSSSTAAAFVCLLIRQRNVGSVADGMLADKVFVLGWLEVNHCLTLNVVQKVKLHSPQAKQLTFAVCLLIVDNIYSAQIPLASLLNSCAVIFVWRSMACGVENW